MNPNADEIVGVDPATMTVDEVYPLERVLYSHQGPNRKTRRASRAKLREPGVRALKNLLNAIWKSVLGFFEGDKAKTEAWFKTSNPMLGGTSPLIMIQNGRVGKLERFVTDALQENQLP